MNTSNFKTDPVSILDFSKRTVLKITRRANLGCAICLWNEATCDIHHIIPRKNGGKDSMDNLICLCPNCHRKMHQFGDKFKTREELKKFSLDETFKNWRDYYNPVGPLSYKSIREKNPHPNLKNNCLNCGIEISIDNNFCSQKCAHVRRKKFFFTKEDVKRWRDEKIPLLRVGKSYGVTDNAIRKRLKTMGLYEFFKTGIDI